MSIHHNTKIDKVSNSSHNHTHRGEERSKLVLACALTGTMFIVEGIAGFLTN